MIRKILFILSLLLRLIFICLFICLFDSTTRQLRAYKTHKCLCNVLWAIVEIKSQQGAGTLNGSLPPINIDLPLDYSQGLIFIAVGFIPNISLLKKFKHIFNSMELLLTDIENYFESGKHLINLDILALSIPLPS